MNDSNLENSCLRCLAATKYKSDIEKPKILRFIGLILRLNIKISNYLYAKIY